MPDVYKCPKCKQIYEFKSEQIGTMFSCMECGTDFVIQPSPCVKNDIPCQKKFPEWLLISLGVFGGVIALLFVILVLFFVFGGKNDGRSQKTDSVDRLTSDSASFERAKKAIEDGSFVELAKIVEKVDLSKRDDSGFTLLFYAVQKGNKDLAQLLLSSGAQVNQTDASGEPAIYYAAKSNNLSMVEFLVGSGAKFDAHAYEADSMLGIASELGFSEIVQFAVNNMESLNEISGKEKAIFRAIQKGHVECVKILSRKIDIESTDRNGDTVLMAALKNGNSDIVSFALKKGASIDYKNRKGETPFFLALRSNNSEILSFFQIDNLDLNMVDSDGMSIPMICAKNKNMAMLSRFITPENIKLADNNGCGLLFYVVGMKNESLYASLIKKGANINAEKFASSPLYAAILNNNPSVVNILLEAGAQIIQLDDDGNDYLMLAAKNGNLEIIKMLLKKDIAFDRKNINGKSAADICHENNHHTAALYLQNLMSSKKSDSVKARAEQIQKDNSLSYQRALAALDELRIQAGSHKEANASIENAKSAIALKEKLRTSPLLNEAMTKAKKDKVYASAIRTLEEAIAAYPLANDIELAKSDLAELKRLQQGEKQKKEERSKKQAKVNAMTQKEIRNELALFINDWLKRMQMGEETSSYWKHPILATTLFSIKSWEIVGLATTSYSANYNVVRILIESSTKGGSPIRKIWKASISRNEDMELKILSFEE